MGRGNSHSQAVKKVNKPLTKVKSIRSTSKYTRTQSHNLDMDTIPIYNGRLMW